MMISQVEFNDIVCLSRRNYNVAVLNLNCDWHETTTHIPRTTSGVKVLRFFEQT